MEDNFLYNLKVPLKYSTKDKGFAETCTVEFSPPNMNIFDESADFEQLCVGAMMSAAKTIDKTDKSDKSVELEKDEKDEKPPSAEDVKMLLMASKDVKFKDIAKIFKKICVKTAKLDDTIFMKDAHFDKLNIDDFKNMLCGYASFFIFPSLMRGE